MCQNVNAAVCIAEFIGHQLIAHLQGFEDQLWGETEVNESFPVFGIQQHAVYVAGVLLILGAVVVTQQQHVQQQLHIVLLLGFWRVLLRKARLARLLLYQDFLVQLQEVHTSLNAQHLREERWLYDDLRGIKLTDAVVLEHFRQHLVNDVLDMLLLLLCLGVEVRLKACRQQA